MDISSHCTAVPRCLPIPSIPSATAGYSLPPSLTKNGRKFEYMRPVNAAGDGASSRPLAENTEAMRRWSLGGGLSARRSRPGQRVLEERSCGTDARGQRDRQRQRGLREAGAWGASEKRVFSELQLTGLRLARRKQEGGPALRAFMFIMGIIFYLLRTRDFQ